MNSKKTIEANMCLLEAMRTVIYFLDDLRAYQIWNDTVPDDKDSKPIAEDDESMDEACAVFRNLVGGKFGHDGWFTKMQPDDEEDIVTYADA